MSTQEVIVPPFIIAYQTDVGRRRRGRPNEDTVGLWVPSEKESGPPLLVVADGMGGHRGGALASQTVVEAFLASYRELVQDREMVQMEDLVHCVHMAHRAVREAGQKHHLPSMGSTVVAAVLFPDRVLGVNVGDSRAYLLQGGRMKRLSVDDSVVAELLRRGDITPEEAQYHPTRNRLTQSISARRDLIYPHTFEARWYPGDQVLLCSDGLWGVVPETKIREVLEAHPPKEAVARLVNLANDMEGPDNISVMVAVNTAAF